MRWLDKNDKLFWYPDNKYKINWQKKAPSKGAQAVKDFLKTHCYGHILFEEYRLPKTLLRVDFLDATKKMAIEFQGEQHDTFNKHFHGDKIGFWNSIKRDVKKWEILQKNDFLLIEIKDEDLPLTRDFFKNQGIIL